MKSKIRPGRFPDGAALQDVANLQNAALAVPDNPRPLRIVSLLEALASRGEPMTLTQLSNALRCPKSSLLLLLRPLVECGYLAQDGRGYRVALQAFRLAANIIANRKFPDLIRPYMLELVNRSLETVYLTVLDREAQLVTYVECIESPQAVRYAVPAGAVRPLYCTSSGRVLLAFQEPAWRERYVRTARLKAITPLTIVDRDALRRDIEETRRNGYAISLGHGGVHAGGISAPIFDADGSVMATLLIAAPVERLRARIPTLQNMILDVATRVSADLGYLREKPSIALRRTSKH
jgi:DNA-binding IclR family transcriptional regulator